MPVTYVIISLTSFFSVVCVVQSPQNFRILYNKFSVTLLRSANDDYNTFFQICLLTTVRYSPMLDHVAGFEVQYTIFDFFLSLYFRIQKSAIYVVTFVLIVVTAIANM